MADSDAIDVAVVAKIEAISGLAAKAPGGVWMNLAKVDTPDPYVIVELQAAKDHAVMDEFDGIAFEEAHYLVKVVGQDPAKVRDAYRLIHPALQDQDLTIAGLFCMDVSRTDRVTYAELDGDARWIHRGGIYVVSASH